MTTNMDINPAAILKDVVAYVDVWSSSKTDNYSKPFIQNLQEMGAEVSKTFNKHVTHVVFKNGHQATWNKAKKTGVRLVSVLWVARCKDECEHVDEDLCPAINDEVNPALKKRTHRCMQPRDTPEKTPESDKRLKKKLDKMMKDLLPIPPLIVDVSPFIIDEENGIVYSPSMKRSDSMAQRLKEMREKRENLSPSASQIESGLSPDPKPSLGSSPSRSLLQAFGDESDDDFNPPSVAQRSDKKPARKGHEDTAGHSLEKSVCKKDSQKPWLSPCSDDVPQRHKSSDYSSLPGLAANQTGMTEDKKPRRTSVKSDPVKKCISPDPDLDDGPKESKSGQSLVESDSLSVGNRRRSSSASKKGKSAPSNSRRRTIQAIHESKTKTNTDLEVGSTLSLKGSKQTKRSLRSPSVIARSSAVFNDSPMSVAPCVEDDEVFDDYFSQANQPRGRQGAPPKHSLSLKTKALFSFELESNPGKRKRGKSEMTGSARPLSVVADTVFDHQQPLKQDVKGLPSTVDSRSIIALTKKRNGQSTLPSTWVNETPSKKRRTNRPPSKPSTTVTGEDEQSPDPLPRHKDGEGRSSTHVETVGRGTEHDASAGDTARTSEICKQNSQVNEVANSMDKETKTMRTLVMTSMPTEKQHTVIQVVRVLGGFSVVERVCDSTTHVVSGGTGRTVNVLLGIARGCWILSFEWILWCLEQRQWIPEEPYELSDHFPAAPICRLQQHLSAGEHQQDLFLGQPAMFVSHISQPPTHNLVELIQLCGGTVCKTVRQAGLCIGEYKGKRPEGSRILSEQWVLDCITHLKQLPYMNYEL